LELPVCQPVVEEMPLARHEVVPLKHCHSLEA
jgi:hypothetical protein